MDKSILGLFLLICLSFFVSGQDLEIVMDSEAGTTPDSFVWGIDRAIENLELALTFNIAKKENKRLENAYERLLEVKEMLNKGKIEDAQRAREKYTMSLRTSIERIEEISDDSSFEDINSLDGFAELQEDKIDDIKVNVMIKGNLSEEQKKRFNDFIESLGGEVRDVRIVINNKKNETLTRIENKTGRSRMDIIEGFEKLRENKIVRAEVFDDHSLIKIGYKFTTKTVEREALIKEIMVRFAINDSYVVNLLKIENSDDSDDSDIDRFRIKIKIIEKQGVSIASVDIILRKNVNLTSTEDIQKEVVNLASLTKEQISDALVIREEHERNETQKREIEINSKIRENIIITKVKIEWDGLKQELVLRTENRNKIIDQISKLLNVSIQEVELAIKEFKIESEDDNDDSERNKERNNSRK